MNSLFKICILKKIQNDAYHILIDFQTNKNIYFNCDSQKKKKYITNNSRNKTIILFTEAKNPINVKYDLSTFLVAIFLSKSIYFIITFR